jgi:hypothetical protein
MINYKCFEKLGMLNNNKNSDAIKLNCINLRKFIDEYYIFHKMCENNKYGINVDDIVKYLNLGNKKNLLND